LNEEEVRYADIMESIPVLKGAKAKVSRQLLFGKLGMRRSCIGHLITSKKS
jgi:hypothetical protein